MVIWKESGKNGHQKQKILGKKRYIDNLFIVNYWISRYFSYDNSLFLLNKIIMTLENLHISSKCNEAHNGEIITIVNDTRRDSFSLISSNITSTYSFRRVMFPSVFEKNTNKLLDDLVLDFFMQTAGWFDEMVMVKVENGDFSPVYDFSLRNKEIDWIQEWEFEELMIIGKKLEIGDWDYIPSEEGTKFDMVAKIDENYLICVNNTNASIDQLEHEYPNRIFEEVKPVIERMIVKLKDILQV